MARIGAPHGLRGDFALQIFSRDPSFFAARPQWWGRRAGADWALCDVADCRLQSGRWLARLAAVADRTAAEQWRGGEFALLRKDLPPAADGEIYWCDLPGLEVVNLDGERIGEVTGITDIGAHDVLEVRAADGRELLLPYVDAYIKEVDAAAGRLRVDWRADW